MRKLAMLLLAFSLLLGACGEAPKEEKKADQTPVAGEQKQEAKMEDSRKERFVLESYGTVNTLDPACGYNSVAHMRMMNIYEPLIFFDGSATDKFVPVLATEVPTVENGGIRDGGKTYVFKIRKGVKFHKGGEMTAEDVAYSIKRHMIVDQEGGPMWMMLEALIGVPSTREDGKIREGIFEKIDQAVEAKGDEVILRLPKPFPPLMAVLAYSYGGIVMDKEWSVANGCWDGTIENAAKYNNPAYGAEPLQKIENGTAPYYVLKWEPSVEFVLERFDDYWGPKPAIKTGIIRYNQEWSSRKLALQNGDADRVIVDPQYLAEVENMPGVKITAVPQLSVTAAIFCQQINPEANPNIGSGKLDGEGIPANFFSDIHVRKAFLHAFDRKTYSKDVWNDQVVMPTNPNAKGMPFSKQVPVYDFDLEAAAAEMKQAFDGQVWEKGFKMVITHNTGNEQREAAAHMLAENIMSLSPKFQVEVRSMDWKDYVIAYRKYQFPMFLIGWGADFPDPDNFMFTFMSSDGVYGKFSSYKNEEVDRLCKEGRFEIDPAKRKPIYERLQDIWYEDAIGCMLYQKVDHFSYRDNVKGYVFHPMLDHEWELFKTLSK